MDKQRFERLVEQFRTARDGAGNPLQMHSVAVQQGGVELVHRFGDRREPSDTRSIAKTVMAIVAGIVAESHDGFGDDLRVWPIFERVGHLTNRDNLERLKLLRVEHLLNQTVGFDRVLLMRGEHLGIDPFTYVDHIINTPMVHDPGEQYMYTNAGYYLLSVVMQEFLGEDLYEYADRVLFSRLGIVRPEWGRYGHYLIGGTRLWLHPQDLLRLGEVFLNDGAGIVSPEWLRRMRRHTAYTPEEDVPTNRFFRRHAYASGLWLGERAGIYFGSGTDGQALVIVPEQNAIVVTQGRQVDVTRLEELVDGIIADMYEGSASHFHRVATPNDAAISPRPMRMFQPPSV